MHRKDLNPNLAEALSLLDINELSLRNDKGEKIDMVSRREHAKALFTYLNIAGYLSENILRKAVEYLAAAKPFLRDNESVFTDLNNVCELSNRNGQFNAEYFVLNFAKQDYFTAYDIIDLIVFLQQTAFDRRYGEERDRLQAKPWMKEHSEAFIENAKKLGVVTPLPPLNDKYPAAGIMGAASVRVKKRLEYFRDLKIDCNLVWALTGDRELSQNLDEEQIIEETAKYVKMPLNYVEKKVGVDMRVFADGITETMMVNYFIKTVCPNKEIGIVKSGDQAGHWRPTAAQSASDIASLIIEKIQLQEIKNTEDGRYHFLVIAEQPYARRMAKQVQRGFNTRIQEAGLNGKIFIEVEGSGPGISEQDLLDPQVLTRLNSELGALMAERFNDARYTLRQKSNLELRDANFIMFSKRDETFAAYKSQVENNRCVMR